MKQITTRLEEYLTGWLGYYEFCETEITSMSLEKMVTKGCAGLLLTLPPPRAKPQQRQRNKNQNPSISLEPEKAFLSISTP
jgi:hypothetical protein